MRHEARSRAISTALEVIFAILRHEIHLGSPPSFVDWPNWLELRSPGAKNVVSLPGQFQVCPVIRILRSHQYISETSGRVGQIEASCLRCSLFLHNGGIWELHIYGILNIKNLQRARGTAQSRNRSEDAGLPSACGSIGTGCTTFLTNDRDLPIPPGLAIIFPPAN
jgi:hypothetical protein